MTIIQDSEIGDAFERGLWKDASREVVDAFLRRVRDAINAFGDSDATRVDIFGRVKGTKHASLPVLVVSVKLGDHMTAIISPQAIDQSDPVFAAGMIASWAGRIRNPDRKLSVPPEPSMEVRSAA